MVTMTHGHPETNRCLWRLLFCVFLDRVLLSEEGVLFGVEARNRHFLVCDRGFCAMFSQSAQEQTVEVLQLMPKEQISEHIVGEIVVLVPQVMEETTEGRVQNRTVDQIRDVLTPQIREENVEETKPIPQERISERRIEKSKANSKLKRLKRAYLTAWRIRRYER